MFEAARSRSTIISLAADSGVTLSSYRANTSENLPPADLNMCFVRGGDQVLKVQDTTAKRIPNHLRLKLRRSGGYRPIEEDDLKKIRTVIAKMRRTGIGDPANQIPDCVDEIDNLLPS